MHIRVFVFMEVKTAVLFLKRNVFCTVGTIIEIFKSIFGHSSTDIGYKRMVPSRRKWFVVNFEKQHWPLLTSNLANSYRFRKSTRFTAPAGVYSHHVHMQQVASCQILNAVAGILGQLLISHNPE